MGQFHVTVYVNNPRSAQLATAAMLDRMQTRAELYQTIGYDEYESLDETIARSIVPPDLRGK